MFQDKRLHEAVEATERRTRAVRPRMAAADQWLATLGRELRTVIVIFLALAILCAPVGLGLVAVWGTGLGIAALTGSAFLGWVAAIAVFLFLCRYVWGARLQGAAKRAAAALVAGRP